MNPETDEPIEKLLRAQPLAEPPASLDRRILAELQRLDEHRTPFGAAPPASSLRWRSLIAAGLALAACTGLALMVHDRPAAAPGSVAGVKPPEPSADAGPPYQIQQVWSELTPGELAVTADRQVVQPVRQQTVRMTRWVDPRRHVRIELQEPQQQELYLVPVGFE